MVTSNVCPTCSPEPEPLRVPGLPDVCAAAHAGARAVRNRLAWPAEAEGTERSWGRSDVPLGVQNSKVPFHRAVSFRHSSSQRSKIRVHRKAMRSFASSCRLKGREAVS